MFMLCSDVLPGMLTWTSPRDPAVYPTLLFASCAVVSYVTVPVSADFLTCSGLFLMFAVSTLVLC